MLGKSHIQSLQKEISKIEKAMAKPFYSEGLWSMHELLYYLLTVTGKADVWLSSFSLSEIAIRSFVNAKEDNLIKSLSCLFDISARSNKRDLLFFANNVIDRIALTKNHSKIIVIKNNEWNIVVVASANLNTNNKLEAGAIFEGKQHTMKFIELIENQIKSGITLNYESN